jgi:hypothetical protein
MRSSSNEATKAHRASLANLQTLNETFQSIDGTIRNLRGLQKNPNNETMQAYEAARAAVTAAKVEAIEAKELADIENTKKGIGITKDIIAIIVERQYDAVMKILAALHEITVEEMEEKTPDETIEIVFEALNDKALMRFFPQLKPLVTKMQSDT